MAESSDPLQENSARVVPRSEYAPFFPILASLLMLNNKYAILVDAGFLKRKLGTRDNLVTVERIREFIDCIKSHESVKYRSLHRVYYYDAPPYDGEKVKPLNGKEKVRLSEDELSKHNIKLLHALQREDYFSLRLGECNFRGWMVKPQKLVKAKGESVNITANDIAPSISQKGVDMRIGLDIASLTLKEHVGAIVLVTGDSDFVPAMKFARREGAQLMLVHLGHDVKDEIYEHSDLALTLDLPDEIKAIVEQNTRARRR